ncbi:MAG: FtsB family cell division protein [Caulobacteraceae bacterium]
MFPRLKTYLPTAALAVLIFYFGYNALAGDKGLLLAHQRKATLAQKRVELAQLTVERKDLELQVKYLSDDDLSRDLLEEKAHVLLGFVDPRDYVIRTPPPRG